MEPALCLLCLVLNWGQPRHEGIESIKVPMLLLGFILGVLFTLIAGFVGVALSLQENATVKDVKRVIKGALPESSIKRGRIFSDKDIIELAERKNQQEASKAPIDRLFPN